MTRLILAELNRLRGRRLTWVTGVLLLLALAALQLTVYPSVRPLSQSEVTQSRMDYEQAKREYDQNPSQNQAAEQECIDAGQPPELCSPEPTPEQFLPRQPFSFAEIANILATAGVYFVGLALGLVAASFIGAEYATGAIANWLTFVPNRTKVLTAKLAAVLVFSAVVGAVALAATVGTTALVSNLAGASTSGLDKIVSLAARGVAMVVVFALLGFAVALLTRHTAGAVGALVGGLVVSFVLSILVEFVTGLGWLKALLPQNQLRAFLEYGYTFPRAGEAFSEGDTPAPLQTISFADSVAYWAILVGVALVLSYVVFRRRDVN